MVHHDSPSSAESLPWNVPNGRYHLDQYRSCIGLPTRWGRRQGILVLLVGDVVDRHRALVLLRIWPRTLDVSNKTSIRRQASKLVSLIAHAGKLDKIML